MGRGQHSLASQYWGFKTPKRDSWNGKLRSTMPVTATSLFPALLPNFRAGDFLGENGLSDADDLGSGMCLY